MSFFVAAASPTSSQAGRCDRCGSLLDIGERQARRVNNGTGSSLCGHCRARFEVTAREVDFRFWADKFQVTIPEGRTARETLATGELPPELRSLIEEFK